MADDTMRYLFYNCTNLYYIAPNAFTDNDIGSLPQVVIGTNFLYCTWSGCTSLQAAVVPDTSGWNVTSIGTYFLYYTWQGCTSLTQNLVVLSNDIKSISNLVSGGGNFSNAFYRTAGAGAIDKEITFEDGTVLSALGTPSSNRQTYTGRPEITPVNPNWK
jgi:hypothetical protein